MYNLNIIQAAIEGSATKVEMEIGNVLKTKQIEAINIKKAEVGANLFNEPCCGAPEDES